MKTCQKHEIKSDHIDINNENTIILYDSKSAVNYINLDYELRLKAFEETSVVKKNDENIITVFECDDLSNMIFRRKRNSANYLMISAAHSIKSSLNILKKDDDLKEKKVEIIHKHKINSYYKNYSMQQKSSNDNSQRT